MNGDGERLNERALNVAERGGQAEERVLRRDDVLAERAGPGSRAENLLGWAEVDVAGVAPRTLAAAGLGVDDDTLPGLECPYGRADRDDITGGLVAAYVLQSGTSQPSCWTISMPTVFWPSTRSEFIEFAR